MKKIIFSCISLMCVCIVLMSLWAVPSFAVSSSPVGFTLANRYTSSTISSAPMTEIGFENFTRPSIINNIRVIGGRYFYSSADNYAVAQIRLQRQDSSTLVDVGSYDISFEGVYYRNYDQVYDVEQVIYYIDYTDGTHTDYYSSKDTSIKYYTNSDPEGTLWRISNLFEFEKPVKYIYIRIYWRLPEPSNTESSYRIGYGNTNITIDSVTWLDKIISGISNTVDGIFNSISSIYKTLVNTVSDSLSDIVNVINNIYKTISSRLSSVVNYLNNIYNAVFNTLSNKLTQIIDIIVGTETEPGLVGHITNFFSNFINTVTNFIRVDWALPSLDSLKENLEQYYEDEDNLFSQFSRHFDEFGNVLNNAEQRFGNARGILAVSNMLSSFIQKNSFLSMLLWFSLAIGIISFILGSSWLVGSFIQNDDKPTHPAQHTHVTMFNFFNRRE